MTKPKKTPQEKLKLKIKVKDQREVFNVMTETDIVIRSRYLRTGMVEIPPDGALNRVCAYFYARVGKLLPKVGLPIKF